LKFIEVLTVLVALAITFGPGALVMIILYFWLAPETFWEKAAWLLVSSTLAFVTTILVAYLFEEG